MNQAEQICTGRQKSNGQGMSKASGAEMTLASLLIGFGGAILIVRHLNPWWRTNFEHRKLDFEFQSLL